MIDLTGVSKVYPVKNGGTVVALDGVNLHVDRGSIHGIVGRSGAGKSTLIRCLTALEKPTEGHIVVDGLDLATLTGSALRAARRRIGMVFQAANLLDARTAADNIGYPLKLAGVPAAKRRERVEELLSLVGLEGRGDSYPSQLSGGQRQRVGVARALANRADILLMDEPFGALDPIVRTELQCELKEIQRVLGTTILFVTHDVDEAFTLGDQVAVLSTGGHIEQVGTPTELLSSPASPFVAEFVGASRAARPVRVAGPGGLVVDDAGTPVGTLTTDEAGERP